MSAEVAGGSKFTKLVAYHVLGHIDGDELVAVVDGEGVTDKLGSDHGCAAPGLDDGFLAGSLHCGDLLVELHGDEGALF